MSWSKLDHKKGFLIYCLVKKKTAKERSIGKDFLFPGRKSARFEFVNFQICAVEALFIEHFFHFIKRGKAELARNKCGVFQNIQITYPKENR